MNRDRNVAASGQTPAMTAFVKLVDLRQGACALVLLVLVLGSPGCGSSRDDLSRGVQGTAKERPDEERYQYEGTGKAKQKTLIRRQDERLKQLKEAAKKEG
jgi:hypothetical protein